MIDIITRGLAGKEIPASRLQAPRARVPILIPDADEQEREKKRRRHSNFDDGLIHADAAPADFSKYF